MKERLPGTPPEPLDGLTELIQKRYDRRAWLYDLQEAPLELLAFARWRPRLWEGVRGRVLELGVGTGKNVPYYPEGAEVTAIDFSPRMLLRAQAKAQRLGREVDLRLMDAQALAFPEASFDFVIASFVFCSVPDPRLGLREAKRVLKPEGRLRLLEHVRSQGRWVGPALDWLNPLAVRLSGANINRRTVENLRQIGWVIEEEQRLWRDIVKLLVARSGFNTRG